MRNDHAECGEEKKLVSFSPITFVSGTKLLAKRTAKFKSYRDLKGRTVVVTEASTNETAVKSISTKENLGINVLAVRDNAQAFEAMDGRQGRCVGGRRRDSHRCGHGGEATAGLRGAWRLPVLRPIRDHVPEETTRQWMRW
jgi:hypothetical protein